MKNTKFKIQNSGGASVLASLVFIFHFAFVILNCSAVDRITATLAVTNAAGTTNGQTLQIAASDTTTRTWTNSVTLAASQILTNNSAAGAATNLYQQLVGTPPLGVAPIVMSTTTNVVLYGQSGVPLVVTLSAGWGTVTYSTQTVAAAVNVRVPQTVETAAQRTNIASGLVDWINYDGTTNQIEQSTPAAAQLVGTTNTQTITGAKYFSGQLIVSNETGVFHVGTVYATNFNGLIGALSNGVLWNTSLASPISTNLENYGNPIASWGYSLSAQAFGYNSKAKGIYAMAVGYGAAASNSTANAFGTLAYAAGGAATALGAGALALADYSVALGNSTTIPDDAPNAIALGASATIGSTHTNSVAFGTGAATTKKNQIMLGSASHVVTVPGSIEHLVTTGTNSFSDLAFRRYAITSLANGNNAGIILGTNSFVEVSGPSSAFTLNGMTGSPSRDGHLVVIVNQTGFDMTIAHQSGTDPVAANRIITMTGADRSTTGNGAAMLIYSAAAARWLLIAFDP